MTNKAKLMGRLFKEFLILSDPYIIIVGDESMALDQPSGITSPDGCLILSWNNDTIHISFIGHFVIFGRVGTVTVRRLSKSTSIILKINFYVVPEINSTATSSKFKSSTVYIKIIAGLSKEKFCFPRVLGIRS